ncbi:MAG TPA: hypothetical protein VN714_20670 [Trebonia sp.]|nr:hypothetical protein [Trebonia sp.]
MFRKTAGGPVGWRKILLAVACVIVVAAVSLSRTVGPGSLNTIWIEDAKFLLNQQLNNGFWAALRTPISSYYQEPARILTGIAAQFPLSWVPGIMAIFAALQYAMYGLVAYIASGPHLRSPWLRLLIAAPVCAIPLAYTQVNNDLVTVQFIGLFGAFWTVLWIPSTRAGRILSPLVMATVSWTAVLSVVFAPLIVARLIVDRSKNAWALTILWASGVWLQLSETVLGTSHHNVHGLNGLYFILRNFVTRVVPRALFGERSLGGAGVDYRGSTAVPLQITNTVAHNALIACAWAVVLLIVVLAAVRYTDPNWTLAVVAALFCIGIFVAEILFNTAVVQPRYVIAPALLLYTALVALMRPRLQKDVTPVRSAVRWLPAAGFAVLLLVAVTLNFRVTNGRTTSPAWTSVVATARSDCAMPGVSAYTYVHEWWFVTIPCSKVG